VFDGIDYSDTVTRNFSVDNQKTGGKGFIPGFEGISVIAAIIAFAWIFRKRNA